MFGVCNSKTNTYMTDVNPKRPATWGVRWSKDPTFPFATFLAASAAYRLVDKTQRTHCTIVQEDK